MTPAWSHRRLMSLPCWNPGLSLSEIQRRRSTGEMLVHFEGQEKKKRRRCVDPAVFRMLVLSLRSVLAPIMISSDKI